MPFEFATAGRIVFGAGVLDQAGSIAAKLGRRALLADGRPPGQSEALIRSLAAAGVSSVRLAVTGEPTTDLIQQGLALARSEGCDLVIGFGGGSAIDAGKALAAMLANSGELLDYLEVVGRGMSLSQPSLPCVAIPTTAGTGAEVTRNAVLASPHHQIKVSLRSPYLLPRVALIDPALTLTLPPAVTASTGMDALAQVIEPYVSSRANPMTDVLCREGMARSARSLKRAYEKGDDLSAREDLALTSLFSGLALANAGLGAVHGFAGPIGGRFHAPHGAVCAALLPSVMETNVRALRQRQPDHPALQRYDEVARILTGDAHAEAIDGATWVAELRTALNIPGLGAYGVTPADIDELVEKSAVASSMQSNPIKLTPGELRAILLEAL